MDLHMTFIAAAVPSDFETIASASPDIHYQKQINHKWHGQKLLDLHEQSKQQDDACSTNRRTIHAVIATT
jgi:hypothetical protein